MKFIITNDDGPNAEGLHFLIQEVLKYDPDPFIVVPHENKSGCGTSSNYNVPIKLEIENILISNKYIKVFKVHGSPIDCVNYAIFNPEINSIRRKDLLLVSGANHGHNMGVCQLASGTCAAAKEACTKGVLAAAISINGYSPFKSCVQKNIDVCLQDFIKKGKERFPDDPEWYNYTIPDIDFVLNKVFQVTAEKNYYEEKITYLEDGTFIRSGDIVNGTNKIKTRVSDFDYSKSEVLTVSIHPPY